MIATFVVLLFVYSHFSHSV